MLSNILKLSALSAAATTLLLSCSPKEATPWDEMNNVLSQISVPVFPDTTYVITDYHTEGDSLFTDAINNAIIACSENGGGTVLIPNGTFKTAPIRLRSNVNLRLSDSTLLEFATDVALFDTVLTRIEGIDCYNISPLIYAYEATNVAITGNGVMDGRADTTNWFTPARLKGVTNEKGEKINEKTLLYQMKEDSLPVAQRVFSGDA